MTPKEFRKRILNNEKIPENTTVNGTLNLSRCTSITALPEGLCVKGYLILYRCTSLTALPEGLCVEGSLYLSRCTSLTALPEGLCVKGGLNLEGCTAIKSLAGIKSVGGGLFVDKYLIESYPFEELPLLINLPFEEKIKDIIKKRYQYESRRIQKKNIK